MKQVRIIKNITFLAIFGILFVSQGAFADTKNESENRINDHKSNESVLIAIANDDVIKDNIKPQIQMEENERESFERATKLVKEGKDEDAKNVFKEKKPKQNINKKNQNKKPEIKQAIDKAKEYETQGKPIDAKKTLNDAGITDKAKQKIESEFSVENSKIDEKPKKLIDILKDFFGLEKPE